MNTTLSITPLENPILSGAAEVQPFCSPLVHEEIAETPLKTRGPVRNDSPLDHLRERAETQSAVLKDILAHTSGFPHGGINE